MRRRGGTLLAGAILLAVLIALASQVTVPYVELGPGPTWNTLGKDKGQDVIQISGAPSTVSAGQLRMVTVGVTDHITLWEAIRGWWSGDAAVVPREVIYPPDQTTKQVDQANAQDFKDSQTSAETAALRKLGYPVKVTVKGVTSGAPADGHLKVGDVIQSVNGTAIESAGDLTSYIQGKPVGAALSIGYQRGADTATTTVATAKGDDGKPRIGIQVEQSQPSPITIKITLSDVGGPSAGLMFSLGIVDKVEPEDLTGGLKIAGTGTIDDDGNVGPIGGISQKLLGAKRDGATVFLVPRDNCAEAVANAVPGLKLVQVSTLDNALAALSTLRQHGNPTLCRAG
jgi:PDZ domain-containing protein